MKKTCGNEVQLARIPEDKEALVSGTQKTLDEWKTRSKRKRFRCQNIPGTILALCNGLQSRLLSTAGTSTSCGGLLAISSFVVLVVVLTSTSKTITVQRIDLSLGLTHLFCENSDYETLRLINGGINLEKKTAIGILQVLCASQSQTLV